MATDFLGKGWAFPLGKDSRGGIATSQGEENVKESIRIILGTAPGERDMRPDFGCGVWNILFDDVDASFAGSVERLVELALRRWEPRIEVKKVKVQAGEEQVLVDVGYTIRATNREDNLVFPFYRGSRE
jgi:phage baseplate assembly protein W